MATKREQKKIYQIFDSVNNKIRNVRDLRIKSYMLDLEKTGEKVGTKGVEFIVVCNNREYKNWIKFDDFIKHNENVLVPGS